MVGPPKVRSIQHCVLQIFSKHPNEDLRRDYIIDEAIVLVGKQLYPQQIDSAIQGLRGRGYRIFPTSPVVHGKLWLRTFKLFTDESEAPPDFSRNRTTWSVIIKCKEESQANRLAGVLAKVLKAEIEVKGL